MLARLTGSRYAYAMRGRGFAAVAGWVAAVVAVPAVVMLLAAGSLSGQPIYEGKGFDPVGFGLSGARVQLLRVALHEGAQVWVYAVSYTHLTLPTTERV